MNRAKLNILVTAVASIGLASAAFLAIADHSKLNPEIRIDENGKVLVRGAKVLSVASSTISAVASWGSASVGWTVSTDGSTEFINKFDKTSSFAEIAAGNTISFSGLLDTASSQLTVKAKTVKNWSVEKRNKNFFGFVESIDLGGKNFTLQIQEGGTLKVLVSDQTKFKKQHATSTSFSSLKANDRVETKGLWDAAANTLEAREIKILVEDRKVFENGRLKSLPASTTPTSMLVTFKKFDYTVNIDADTAVLNKNWGKASLGDFKLNDHIRVYGAADGATIDATVIRNMDL